MGPGIRGFASRPRALRVTAGAFTAAGLLGALTAVPALAADRAEPGPDLVISEHPPVSGVRPRSATGMSFSVKNEGNAPATRVALFLNGSQGLSFAEKYTNCVYEDTPAQDEGPAQVNATCDIEQTLEPGAVYVPEKPVGLNILGRALYEHFGVNAMADSPTFPGGAQQGGGSGRVLRLVEQKPADPGTVYGEELRVPVTAENTADFSLTGAELRGRVGDTVTADVKFANEGPAWVANDVSTPIGVFDVGIPAGTKATTVPDFCLAFGADGEVTAKGTPGAPRYRCTTAYDYADENSVLPRVFKLRIDKIVPGATGTVSFVKGSHRWGTLPFDSNPANNTAKIVVNAAGGSAGPGATAGAGSRDTPRTAPGGGPQDDELADTGAGYAPLIGGTAGAALLAGGGLLLTSRRARTRSSLRRAPVRGTSR